MRLALMIEGQENVAWDDWVALAGTAERLGFHALFRSDHYLSVDGVSDRGALDAWGTICGLAAVTSTVRLGTLVSPATFRNPSVLAKLVTTADHISGGRVELGIGAGWFDGEHLSYGFPFGTPRSRFDMLEEQVEIIRRSWERGPFSFDGANYTVRDLDALPKPVQQPHPPLIMGGSAGRRSAALAARWADEYNVVLVSPETAAERRANLDAACEAAGRDPSTLARSLMTGFLIGADEADLRRRAELLGRWRGEAVDLEELGRTWLVGTPDRIAERLREYADAAGIERVMLQHNLYHDDEALELMARAVAPAVAA